MRFNNAYYGYTGLLELEVKELCSKEEEKISFADDGGAGDDFRFDLSFNAIIYSVSYIHSLLKLESRFNQ